MNLEKLDLNQIATALWPWSLKILAALAILFIGLWIARRLQALTVRLLARAEVDMLLRRFLSKVVYWIAAAVVVFAALERLGVNMTSALAIMGAAGLAIGLALKDSLSNVASGVMLILFRPFEVGQYVEAGGVGGIVKEVTLFSTVLVTPDNRQVLIPNSAIYSTTITNYSANETRRIDLVFGIGYEDDIDKARSLIEKEIKADSRILEDPAPFIAVSELGDSSVDFVVRPWVKTTDFWTVKCELTEAIKKTFDKNNISIPYPQRDVHLFQQTA